MQEAVQRARDYHVNFELDVKLVEKISKECGSKALKDASSWYRFLKYHSGERFYGFSVDGVAFLMGSFAKNHFRLAEIAVSKTEQGVGYGAFMLSVLFEECARRNIKTITLRTSRQENAYKWYQIFGAQITGVKNDDWEMRIDI